MATQLFNETSTQVSNDLACQEDETYETYETYDEQEYIVEKALDRQKNRCQKAVNKKARQKASRLDAKSKRQEVSQHKQQENTVLPCHNVHDLMEIYKINMQENAQYNMEAQSFSFDQKQESFRMAEILASIKPARPQTSKEIDF